MLFKPELCQAILDGTKTQTRRLVKPGDKPFGYSWKDGVWRPVTYVRSAAGRLRWKTGRTYAIQLGRGKKAIGRIRLLAIRKERLQDISEADMQAEGVNPCDFTYAWADSPEVWVLEFVLVEEKEK